MRWVYEDVNRNEIEKISSFFGIPKLASEIILRRKIEDIENYLYPTEKFVYDPFLMTDMDKAVDILIDAWKKKKKILIHGDYDVDGITGASLLYSFMKKKGWKVDVYIPDRMNEGYGISLQAVRDFAKNNGDILLTVDCGSTAVEELEEAKRLGLTVVVTDHHEVKDILPPADALVNPHRPGDRYPFKELAGVGVAFKLIQALADRFGMSFEDIKDCLDLVALGTVADMVTLSDENRFYVKEGLKILGKSRKRPGLRKLVSKLGLNEIRSKDISYKIAPRLNAAGRMGTAMDAFRLVVSESEQEAEKMVEKLLSHNLLRQEIETSIFKEAVEMVEERKLHKGSVIVVGGENWHVGVIGIVASRIANKYGKPALVISFSNGLGKGSARSVNGANIYEVFQKFEGLFEEFGGHTMAVGFTIKRSEYEKLRDFMREVNLKIEEKVVNIDAEINPRDINPELFEVIDLFEPFGLGNPPLVFLMKNLDIKKASFFNGGNSVNLTLRRDGRNVNAVWMGIDKDFSTMIRQGAAKMDVLCEIEPNFLSPKLKVVDAKFKSGIDEIDSMVDLKTKSKFDKEEIIMKKRGNLADEIEDRSAVFVDIRTRNSMLIKLFGKKKFIVCCKTMKEHIANSLRRHIEINDEDFLTIEEFLEKEIDSGIVVLEPQILLKMRGIEEVEEFIKRISKMSKIAIGTRIPDGIRPLLVDMRFKKLRVKLKKLKVRIQMQSGFKSFSKSFAIVSRNPEEYKDLTSGQYYSNDMNRFQRASIVNLIKRKALKKFATTPSTDGLPTFIPGNEVFFLSKPRTLYELLDAVHPVLDDKTFVLSLNYDEEKFELDGLDEIYYENITRKILEKGTRSILRHLQDPGEII